MLGLLLLILIIFLLFRAGLDPIWLVAIVILVILLSHGRV